MTEPAITPELVAKHNLTPEEYAKIQEILGREPSYTELGIFSVMWSEHCSYKNTKPAAQDLPHQVAQDPRGRRRGKRRHHRHRRRPGHRVQDRVAQPSQRGRAVPGRRHRRGRHRARHLHHGRAAQSPRSNSLRFGELSNPEVRRLFGGVVAGIAHYGNCFGIPTLAGEVYFDKSYEGNPLVNVFCLGVLRHDQIARGAAKGIGNPVFYVGPATGRDGLAGAAFASQDLTEESAEQQRGAVQVGDPFMEKLVCEACLELLATGAVAGIQDMGAAGLTCSTCETAARAGTGIEIELDKVPQRAPNMTQLRDHAQRIPGAHADHRPQGPRGGGQAHLRQVGPALVGDRLRHRHRPHGGAAPRPGRGRHPRPARSPTNRPSITAKPGSRPTSRRCAPSGSTALPDTTDPVADLKKLLAWPTIASKNWVYRQYDHMVRDNSVVCPGSDAAVIRIKADSLRRCPAEPISNLKSPIPIREIHRHHRRTATAPMSISTPTKAARPPWPRPRATWPAPARVPLGVTDNLNFGNPHNPELFWQLKESVRGLADACRAFNAPVTGGNCSLYNQSPSGPIDPTPTVAMVGLIEKPEHITTQWFKDEGDAIILLGAPVDAADPLQGLGGSAYLQVVHGQKTGTAAALRSRPAPRPCTPPCSASSRPAASRARTIAAKAASPWRWPSAASPNSPPATPPGSSAPPWT